MKLKLYEPLEIFFHPKFGYDGPRGDVRLRGRNGKVYDTFICHGCQSCWRIDNDQDKPDAEDYIVDTGPHFYAIKEVPLLTYTPK